MLQRTLSLGSMVDPSEQTELHPPGVCVIREPLSVAKTFTTHPACQASYRHRLGFRSARSWLAAR
jgi:hypothetical protein